jgi:hypothetical protein
MCACKHVHIKPVQRRNKSSKSTGNGQMTVNLKRDQFLVSQQCFLLPQHITLALPQRIALLHCIMPPQPWATADQAVFLHTWMADFLRRQAEKKLGQFWAPVYSTWFSKYPEQVELHLPLPDNPDARQLTPEENTKLGVAITERKKVWMFPIRCPN